MIDNERALPSEIKKLVLASAELYDRKVGEMGLEMWSKVLESFKLSELSIAFRQHVDESKFMPVPADIVQRIRPKIAEPDDTAIGADVANRIVAAMGSFGYLQDEKARNYVGEIGWEVIKREGGWQALCERTKNEDLPIHKAQWRELAKSLILQSRAGRDLNRPPSLPKQLRELLEKKE